MNTNELRHSLSGPITSLRIPFHQDGQIDYAGLRNIIEFDIAAGSGTIMLTFGDSHYSVLTDDEVAEITRKVVEHVKGRALVIAADRPWWTGKARHFARYCREVGADMLMVLPPDWAASATPQSFADHYTATAAEIPVMIVTAAFLNRPINFTLETLKLVMQQAPGVVALKDDLCGERGRKVSLLVHPLWAFVSGGQKQNHLDVLPYGCDGYLSTFMTFQPKIAHAYWSAIQSRDMAAAAAIIRDYDMPLFNYLVNLPGGFDAGIHGILELAGLSGRWRRLPYYSLNDAEMEQLKAFLAGLPPI